MTSTIIIQSHAPNVPDIVARGTETVRALARAHGFEYAFKHDDLFDLIPEAVIDAAGPRKQMAADIARLVWIKSLLDDGWDRVIWLDADVHVFRPDRLSVETPSGFTFGREHWVQPDKTGRLKLYNNVHNAFLVFTPEGRATLDFYHEQAERILLQAGPDVPPQLVGPKLLTALNNVVGFPLNASVGMASPRVIEDLSNGGGAAWELMLAAHGDDLAAVNLSTSLLNTTTDGVEVTAALLERAVGALMSRILSSS